MIRFVEPPTPRLLAAGDAARATFAHVGYMSATAQWPVPGWARPLLGPGMMVAGVALLVSGFAVKRRAPWRGWLTLIAAALLLGSGLVLRAVLMEPYEAIWP